MSKITAELAEQWGLSVDNDSVEDTIAQRDAALSCIGEITTAFGPSPFGLKRVQRQALDKAAELHELIEAIVSGEGMGTGPEDVDPHDYMDSVQS